MTEFEDFRAAITGLFAQGWQNHFVTEWPNQPNRIDRSGQWCRFSIQEGDRDYSAVGIATQRTYGMISIQLFVPLETGTRSLTQAAGLAAAAIERRCLAPVAGMDVELYPARMSGYWIDGAHYCATVSIPWRRDIVNAA